MLQLHIQAPFAVFRTFHTGSFRPTAEFITHSAAYGLLLNLAGIESRYDDGKSAMTLMCEGLPRLKIAVGAVADTGCLGENLPRLPRTASVFQQLHNYPVGTSGKEHAPSTKGNKYNITPVRREFLVDFQAVLHADADAELEDRILGSLTGERVTPRYGLPFLGDNAFLLDWIRSYDEACPVFWFERVDSTDDVENSDQIVRLTQWIDRADSSQTKSQLFAPTLNPTPQPRSSAIVELPPW